MGGKATGALYRLITVGHRHRHYLASYVDEMRERAEDAEKQSDVA